LAGTALGAQAPASRGRGAASPVPMLSYTIVHTYPHDRDAFTQGLQFVDGVLYEGTGLNGRSTLRKVDLPTGRVLQQIDLPQQYFGEGIAVL
jgi:glutamine cyclotransferase